MRIPLLVTVLGVLMLVGTNKTKAADLRTSVRPAYAVNPGVSTERLRVRRHVVFYRSRPFVIRKTIGMPCVLPPHWIVQLNWNGPQCRWQDNITPSARYRIAFW